MSISDNVEFWNDAKVIGTQDRVDPRLLGYESYLLEQTSIIPDFNPAEVKTVQVMGCGTGREVFGVAEFFPNAHIVASDIAQSMLDGADKNLSDWGIRDRVELVCSPVESLQGESGATDVIVMFNNMFTYVLPQTLRHTVMQNNARMLAPQGLLLGVLHNRWGRWTKSMYFSLQPMWSWLMHGVENGDRIGGFANKRIRCHYFTQPEVTSLMQASGFEIKDMFTLEDHASRRGKTYDKRKGYNNLLFLAQKSV